MNPPGRHQPQPDGLRQTTDSPPGLAVSGLSPNGKNAVRSRKLPR